MSPLFKDEKLRCSFCGKRREQVPNLIAGPGVYICVECVELCNEIIRSERSDKSLEYSCAVCGVQHSVADLTEVKICPDCLAELKDECGPEKRP